MDKPVITEWSGSASVPGGEVDRHTRTVGDFSLVVEDTSIGWAWSVEWGDNAIAEGEIVGGDPTDPGDAKAACEAAACKAGIAVPR